MDNDFQSAFEYYWGKNGVIKKEDIEDFEKKYRGSDDERNDLIEFFQKLD